MLDMKDRMTFAGYLNIGQHKSISVTCNLSVEVIEDDEWGETPEYNQAEYLNGVRIEGDLYFDAPPIQTYYQDGRWVKHPVQKNVIATLSLHQGEESSRFNIILIDKVSEIHIIPKKLVRYFWTFFPIGNPLSDKLGIFPEQYRWNNQMNRVYYCTNFRGAVWPHEVASIVVAPDKKKARQLLDAELKLLGIQIEGGEMYTLTEIDTTKEKAMVLSRG
jgi:hypothetical protein